MVPVRAGARAERERLAGMLLSLPPPAFTHDGRLCLRSPSASSSPTRVGRSPQLEAVRLRAAASPRICPPAA